MKLEPMRGNHTMVREVGNLKILLLYLQLWTGIKSAVLDCDKPPVDILSIRRYDNADDTKYHIHPIQVGTKAALIVHFRPGSIRPELDWVR